MDALSVTSPESLPSLPDAWTERLFQAMEDRYGAKWIDSLGGIPRERVKRAWGEDLADFTGMELKRGLDACKTRVWPPTLPEFMGLCRPVVDSKTEWAEAREQMRVRLEGRGADVWSRPQVYWAAVAIGWYDLNSTAWDQIKVRWDNALHQAKTDPIPEYRTALPAPGRESVTRDEAVGRVAELRQKVAGVSLPGTTKPGTEWAYRLMEREAGGEPIEAMSRSAWREVLGYAPDYDAKKALEAVRAAA